MRVLVTGAGGFLGRGMVRPFEEHGGYELRLMDVVDFDSPHEVVVGDVRSLEDVERAVEGVDAVIIAHMAPRRNEGFHERDDADGGIAEEVDTGAGYGSPGQAFDINVKGTANIYHAADQAGVRKVVQVSTIGVLSGHPPGFLKHDVAPRIGKTDYYGISKSVQEAVSQQCAYAFGIQVSAIRVSWIVDAENMCDKYGKQLKSLVGHAADRADIGEVARLCLEREDDVPFETFFVASSTEAYDRWDVQYTCERLGWRSKYT